MMIKYNVEIRNEDIIKNINKLTNHIFKLLPNREEGGNWKVSLENLLVEISGMTELLKNHAELFSLLCKLEALKQLDEDTDFLQFRKTIFECLGHLNEIKKIISEKEV